MHRAMRIPVSMVILATVGCAPSSPSRPTAAATSDYAARVAAGPWSRLKGGGLSARGVRAAAVINGFRVHPDPGDDGVIRVAEGENVVVNATDIASRPPAPRATWSSTGGTDRTSAWAAVRAAWITPTDGAAIRWSRARTGSRRNAEISVTVEVSGPPREKRRPSRFEFFGIVPEQMPVGAIGRIVIPLYEPPGVTLFDSDIFCEPFDIIEPSGSLEIGRPD